MQDAASRASIYLQRGSAHSHLGHHAEARDDWGARLGVCLDSCHLLASGYDIRTAPGLTETMDEFDRVVGIKRLGSLDLGIRSVLVTSGCDPDDGVAAIRAGARAFMPRSDLLRCSLPRLLEAVMADELICSRAMATAMAERLHQ